MQTKTNDVDDFLSEKQILKENVIWLENENEELSEKVNELMNNKEIITFQGGGEEIKILYVRFMPLFWQAMSA